MVSMAKQNKIKVLVHIVLQIYMVKCQSQENQTELEATETSLQMRNKQLTSIPEGHLQLKKLDLSYNSLNELPQNVFQRNNYSNLERALLNNNAITNLTSGAFHGLLKITEIDLSYNNLTTIDSYTFKYNAKLTTLVLIGNKLKLHKFQPFLISNSLQYLLLTDNSIDQVYDVSFVMLPNLRSLSLSQNKLVALSGNCFKTLTNLRYLNVAETFVDRLVLEMFPESHQSSLRTLNLEKTPLAKNFDPPLTKIRADTVRQLLILLSIQ